MSRRFPKKPGRFAPVLIAVLTAAVLLSALGGTMAWLRYARSLHTLARIQVPSMTLTGPQGESTLPVALGDMDLSQAGSKESIFRIASNTGTHYILQLAHTTNLPLKYTIYKLSSASDTSGGTALAGNYRNGDGTLHSVTYGDYDKVQKNAQPLYWQSEVQTSSGEEFYVLVVTWDAGANNKETDMIYITAGIGGDYEQTQP
mgnify:FL=1